MRNDNRKFTRRDALKAGAVLAAPFIAKYSRAAGPMAGKRMGYSMSFATIEWLVAQRRGVEEASRAAGFELVFADARDNPAKQVRDLEDMVTQKCDVILVSTYYAEAITPAVRMINEAGIPLVVLSSTIKGDVSWTCHLSTDTLGTARTAGEYFVSKLGGKGRVVQIEGKPGSVVNQMRGTGWTEVLARNPGIEIVKHVVANYERMQALRHMEDILRSTQDIAAVYCHNDEMALGAIKAIKEADRSKEMWVTGYDGIQADALEAIHNGELRATWQYLPFGTEAVDAAVRILQGAKVPREIVFPSPLITRDNVAEYYDAKERKVRPFKSRLKI
ncbi:MAG TPA: substrate-binding domain-containing protein [Burkholderiales bacterium]|nr:substrate-binding domain-containing protein [Burkholderiales bacterium]